MLVVQDTIPMYVTITSTIISIVYRIPQLFRSKLLYPSTNQERSNQKFQSHSFSYILLPYKYLHNSKIFNVFLLKFHLTLTLYVIRTTVTEANFNNAHIYIEVSASIMILQLRFVVTNIEMYIM